MSSPLLTRRHMLMTLPLVGAAGLGFGFWSMLSGMQAGSFDPRDIRAPAVDRPVPEFKLPALPGAAAFSSVDLQRLRAPVLVNFFASWCLPCVAEMAALRRLKALVPIWGVAYKDKTAHAQEFITRAENPYNRVIQDQAGLVAIDWGVSGVPESFLIAPGGRICWHLARALTDDIISAELAPLVHSL